MGLGGDKPATALPCERLVNQVKEVRLDPKGKGEFKKRCIMVFAWWKDGRMDGRSKDQGLGLAQWLMAIIPGLWEVEAGGWLERRSLRSDWATWQNLISTKNS